MTLEQQVCSLDLAKRLKELGVKQESLFYWIVSKDTNRNYLNYGIWKHGEAYSEGEYPVSAFTVAELGEMLPSNLETDKGGTGSGYLECYRVEPTTKDRWIKEKRWECAYDGCLGGKYFKAETEADARAKCLIYLLKNKLIEL